MKKHTIKNNCYLLGKIVIALGIIASIMIAIDEGVVTTTTRYGNAEERSLILTIMFLLYGLLFTAIGSMPFFVAGKVIELLESIQENTRINSTIQSNILASENTNTVPSDSWKCSQCGRVNKNYIGECACGQSKNNN